MSRTVKFRLCSTTVLHRQHFMLVRRRSRQLRAGTL